VTVAIVIPARMASTRFPGKPLVKLAGKPMIQWVVEAAHRAELGDNVWVATPDPAIAGTVAGFGGFPILTGNHHVSGTDRVAEVAQSRPADIYVNVQGDEPLIAPETIRACAQPLLDNPEVQMASVWTECSEEEQPLASVVKCVTDLDGFALYFSRHPIPFPRQPRAQQVKKHVGLYAFRREVLLQFATWTPTPLEQAESLEQLRFLEHGVRIKMARAEASVVAVDTPEQAAQAEAELERLIRKVPENRPP
jgi:3-deoxy-manno-octulosonate cytidylyltransferase (CMP-KDO synthetase)